MKTASRNWRTRLIRFSPYLLCFLVFLVLPPIMPSFLRSMMCKVCIFAIFALSLNLIWGYTGLISLGHAAYFGVGAYTSAILIAQLGIENFWISGIVAILAAGFLSTIFGIIALRVSGLYFLLVTLALAQVVYFIALAWTPVTGGNNGVVVGIPYPDLGIPWLTWNSTYFYLFILLITTFCYFILYQLIKSPFGHALQGIRDNEPKMRTLGYNVWLHKYIIFIISGIFAGIAGVLFSYFLGFVGPTQLGITTSSMALLMIIIGGTRIFWGPIVGSIVIIIIEYFASLFVPTRWPLILGTIFVVAVMFLPQGISYPISEVWKTWNRSNGSTES